MGYENAAAAEDHLVTVPLHLWSSSFFFRRGNELDSPPLGFSHSVWIGNIKPMLDESFILFFSFIAFGLEGIVSSSAQTASSADNFEPGNYFQWDVQFSYSYFIFIFCNLTNLK